MVQQCYRIRDDPTHPCYTHPIMESSIRSTHVHKNGQVLELYYR